MERPTIADLARAAQVSVSTVDRVLNARDPVRSATAARVLAAAEAIGFHASGVIRQRIDSGRPARTFGFLLQQRSSIFYQGLGRELADAVQRSGEISGRSTIEYMEDLSASAVSERLLKLGREVDAIAVVAADHANITLAVDELERRGVPVFALISDLTAQSRAGYVGLDNWKVGRTAAWAVSNLCKQPGKVGIFVGSHRYQCQDVCEMSFRSYFREHAPDFQLLEPLTSLEEPRYAYENTLDLLKRNRDLVGLFVAGGGIEGVMHALRDEGPEVFGGIVTVGLELTDTNRSGLIDGVLRLVLAHPIRALAEAVVLEMARATEKPGHKPLSQVLLPFDIYAPENI